MVTVVSVYGTRIPSTTRTDQTRRLAVADNGRAYTVILGACPVNRAALVAAAARQRPINAYQTNPPIVVLPLADAIAGGLTVLASIAGVFRDTGSSNGATTNVTESRRDIGGQERSQERQMSSTSERHINAT